jgi:hypothetical protein
MLVRFPKLSNSDRSMIAADEVNSKKLYRGLHDWRPDRKLNPKSFTYYYIDIRRYFAVAAGSVLMILQIVLFYM